MVRRLLFTMLPAVLFNMAGNAENFKSVQKFENGVCSTSFQVSVEESGYYYLGAWAMPVKLTNGMYEEYKIVVNNEKSGESLKFSNGDWQTTDVKSLYLNKGTNVIVFTGGSTLFPNVTDIKVSKEKAKVVFANEAYSSYKENAMADKSDIYVANDSISNNFKETPGYVAFNDDLKFQVTDDNQIILNAAYDGNVTVKFISAENGRFIAAEKYSCTKGKNVLPFDAMSKGVYLVIVELDGRFSAKKIIR